VPETFAVHTPEELQAVINRIDAGGAANLWANECWPTRKGQRQGYSITWSARARSVRLAKPVADKKSQRSSILR
jgi:hypothetical protein